MKYDVGDLVEDRRGSFAGEIGVIVDTFFAGDWHHYKIFWISGHWAGRISDESVKQIDNGDNCRSLKEN